MKKRILSLAVLLFMLFTLLPVQSPAAAADYTPRADALNALGLFLGTATGYNLDRDMTRAEAAVMVVRLLGKEKEAQTARYGHPFTDVPDWAKDYIGYLFHFDITKGTSATRYGSNSKVTPAQYATFMLRSLSYDDDAGDFSWQKALDKMSAQGVLTASDAAAFGKNATLLRGSAVAISYASLLAAPKGSYYTLLQRLYVSEKAFTRAQLAAAAQKDEAVAQQAAMMGVPRAGAGSGTIMDAEAIYKKVSPTVFYIEVFDTDVPDDYPVGTGSGFFITPEGIAVTNYHVIEDARSARITTANGKTYDVDRVLAFSEEQDIAVLQIAGGGFSCLHLGDPAKLRTAQKIYSMGSPLGFADTITDGLVSSGIKNYPEAGRELIQISVPISPGSSGGALLNEYGEVVGITTYETWGQNLNFAIPVTDLSKLTYLDPPRTLNAVANESMWSYMFSGEPDFQVEEEEDNDDAPAQTLENEMEYLCTLEDEDDVDLFEIKADKAKEFMLVWRTPDLVHREHARVEVVDMQTGDVVIAPRVVEDTGYLYLFGHLKKGGQYALRVSTDGSPDAVWADTPYEFACYTEDSVTGKSTPYDYYFSEWEPNDTFETAQYQMFGGSVSGMVSDKDDKDVYKFTLDASASVSIICMIYFAEPIKAVLYDSAGKQVAALTCTAFSGMDSPTLKKNTRTLSAGDYYIEISGSVENAEEYPVEYYCYVGDLDPEYESYWW